MEPKAVNNRGELDLLFREQAWKVTTCWVARTSGVSSVWQCDHMGDEYHGADGCLSTSEVVLDHGLGGLAHVREPASCWKPEIDFRLASTGPVTWRVKLGQATPLKTAIDEGGTVEPWRLGADEGIEMVYADEDENEGPDQSEEYDPLFWGDRLNYALLELRSGDDGNICVIEPPRVDWAAVSGGGILRELLSKAVATDIPAYRAQPRPAG